MTEAELDLLAERWRDGELVGDEAAELAVTLGADAALRDGFLERVRLAQLVHDLLVPAPIALSRQVVAASVAHSDGDDRRLARCTLRHTDRHRRHNARLVWVGLAAAAVLLAAIALTTRSAGSDVAPVGVWLPTPTAGSVTTPDGSEVAYEAGTRLRVRPSNGGIELEAGAVTCQVAPHTPRAMWQVETPFATVSVLGTRFGVRVDDAGQAVHVDRGLVAVAPLGGKKIELAAGDALWVDHGGAIHGTVADGLWVPVWRSRSALRSSGQPDGAWTAAVATKPEQLNPYFEPDSFVQWRSEPDGDPLFRLGGRMRLHVTVQAERAGQLSSTWQALGPGQHHSRGHSPVPVIAGEQLLTFPLEPPSDGSDFAAGWFALWGYNLGDWRVGEVVIERAIEPWRPAQP